MDHQDIAYRPQAFPDVPASECDPRPIVEGTAYSVDCPACHGQFRLDDLGTTFRGRVFTKRAKEPTRPIPVVCDCGFAHADRPADASFQGCGAAWRLTR